MTLRVRCQVLQAIAAHGPITTRELIPLLPDITPDQIRKAAYNLLQQDRVFKVGVEEPKAEGGRACSILEARDNFEPPEKKAGKKKGRKKHSEVVRTNRGGFGTNAYLRYRDRKIRLLLGLVDTLAGANRDLMIGILADYGHKY